PKFHQRLILRDSPLGLNSRGPGLHIPGSRPCQCRLPQGNGIPWRTPREPLHKHVRMIDTSRQVVEVLGLMKQTTFASAAWDRKGKVTRRERFLREMDAVIPWPRLMSLIEPHYPKAGAGRHPHPLERMLRVYFMQNWFNLSDPQAEDSLYDSESMRRFAGIELAEDRIPDESTILRFRHLLEAHDLTEAIFNEVRSLLEERRLLVKSGTIVDATVIAAPPSTKNAKKARDPEMRQGKKGREWHFGMKAHVGTDRRGIVHSLTTTHAGAADIDRKSGV